MAPKITSYSSSASSSEQEEFWLWTPPELSLLENELASLKKPRPILFLAPCSWAAFSPSEPESISLMI